MQVGDLQWVISADAVTCGTRPVFFDWRIQELTADIFYDVPCLCVVMILSESIMNPYDTKTRLRRVLTSYGMGYMYEAELFCSMEEAIRVGKRVARQSREDM